MTLFEIIVGVVAGLIAGMINTLAGNGSALTLAILLEFFGLPAHMANGTNRIGVLAQTSASVLSFRKEGLLNFKNELPLIVLPVVGAFLGIYLAIIISSEGFIAIYKYLLVLMLVVIVVNPKRWIKKKSMESSSHQNKWLWPFYFLLGVYGGFIQMGMGIFTLILFVLLGDKNIISANVLKAVIIAIFTLAAVAIFAWQHMIYWGYGITLGIGQMFGGWFTARFASRHSRAAEVAYFILIICIVGAIWSVFFRYST